MLPNTAARELASAAQKAFVGKCALCLDERLDILEGIGTSLECNCKTVCLACLTDLRNNAAASSPQHINSAAMKLGTLSEWVLAGPSLVSGTDARQGPQEQQSAACERDLLEHLGLAVPTKLLQKAWSSVALALEKVASDGLSKLVCPTCRRPEILGAPGQVLQYKLRLTNDQTLAVAARLVDKAIVRRSSIHVPKNKECAYTYKCPHAKCPAATYNSSREILRHIADCGWGWTGTRVGSDECSALVPAGAFACPVRGCRKYVRPSTPVSSSSSSSRGEAMATGLRKHLDTACEGFVICPMRACAARFARSDMWYHLSTVHDARPSNHDHDHDHDHSQYRYACSKWKQRLFHRRSTPNPNPNPNPATNNREIWDQGIYIGNREDLLANARLARLGAFSQPQPQEADSWMDTDTPHLDPEYDEDSLEIDYGDDEDSDCTMAEDENHDSVHGSDQDWSPHSAPEPDLGYDTVVLDLNETTANLNSGSTLLWAPPGTSQATVQNYFRSKTSDEDPSVSAAIDTGALCAVASKTYSHHPGTGPRGTGIGWSAWRCELVGNPLHLQSNSG